jgi:L-fuconolactonase
VKPVHLPALLTMLDRNPDLAVVVDHGAKPDIASGAWKPWARLMRVLASNPRVRCKLSALVTEAGAGRTIDTLRRYVDFLAETFGPQRLMWGSDWPVVNLTATYQSWYAATIALTSQWRSDDKAALMRAPRGAFTVFSASFRAPRIDAAGFRRPRTTPLSSYARPP